MANKIELVKSELAFHGIRVTEDGQCYSFMEGQDKPVKSNCIDKIKHLVYETEENKGGLKSFWIKTISMLSRPPFGTTGGTSSTEKLFANSLKQLLRFARRYRAFRRDALVLQKALRNDVKVYTETVMSKVVDYAICVQWLDHLVRHGVFCCKLLAFFDSNRGHGTITAQQTMPYGTFDMEGDDADPLKERRWEWDDDEFKEDARYETNTDVGPKSGFFFVETTPTMGLEGLYDELGGDNDPYKHYYNFKSKVHRGVDV